ncbi:hypothetical protein WBJ53_28110 [Spirosoma sp. SC4-14]|uniref:hypothetical protein n=1 Tax=Spirosoma sp. SC4-14 TaxID=3128900 RepID=UPI0030D36912
MAAGAPVRFYHGHEGCRYFVVPKTRTDWWLNKINGNKIRDAENEAKLVANGRKITTISGCKLKPKTKYTGLQNSLKIL